MRFHWQNLDVDQEERPLSNGWRHGRFWWRLKEQEKNFDQEIAGEWAFFGDLSVSFGVDMEPSEGEWTLHVGFGRVAQFWLHLRGLIPMPPTPGYESRRLGFDLHDGAFFWDIWKDPGSWSRDDGWRKASWSWRDFLQGRPVYRSEVLKVHEHVPVPLPEASYSCRIELRRDTWTRKRAPFGIGNEVRFRADIKPDERADGTPGRIPHPGKWGGEDGLFGLTTPARNLAEAVSATVDSVLQSRARHGGRLTYVPSPVDN
jgi:hypothetical protein